MVDKTGKYLFVFNLVGCIHAGHQHRTKPRGRNGECDWIDSVTAELDELLLHSTPLPQAVATETRATKDSDQVSTNICCNRYSCHKPRPDYTTSLLGRGSCLHGGVCIQYACEYVLSSVM